jgi:hypothetical protein
MQPNSKYQVQPNANPYAAPIVLDRRTGKPLGFSGGGMSAEKIRREHAHDEVTLYYFGYYHIVCGAILALVGLGISALLFLIEVPEGESIFFVIVPAIITALIGIVRLAIGLGLIKLTRFGLVGGMILHVLGLLGIPFETMFSIYFLIIINSEKGKKIFSPEYRAVIDATPNFRRPVPIIGWLFLGVFAIMVLGFVIGLIRGFIGLPGMGEVG